MGWYNPPFQWTELERRMSGRVPRPDGAPAHGKRHEYMPPTIERIPEEGVAPYAELHAHSAFSFLDGASMPEHLVLEAWRLRLSAIAITDHDGFYGAAEFARAAVAHEMPTVYGAELSLGLPRPQNGEPDPVGSHLLILARGQAGYHRIATALTSAHLEGGEKGLGFRREVYAFRRFKPFASDLRLIVIPNLTHYGHVESYNERLANIMVTGFKEYFLS